MLLRILVFLFRIYITLAVPIILALISVRFVMTPVFLEIEYNRPGFPADHYGFTREERLDLGKKALRYLLNSESIEYLGDQTFPNGIPLYNERELRHMVDVKDVTKHAFQLLVWLGVALLVLIGLAYVKKPFRREITSALIDGSILTLGIIGVIVFMALTAWDVFFTAFHNIFFESGTWRFAYSDTLIRLFPEQFWFDAAVTTGIMTTFGALAIILVIWRLRKTSNTDKQIEIGK